MLKKIILILIAIIISLILFIFCNMYTAIPSARLTVDYKKIEPGLPLKDQKLDEYTVDILTYLSNRYLS